MRLSAGAPADTLVRAAMLLFAGLLAAQALACVAVNDLSWQQALGERVLLRHDLPATLGYATFTAPTSHWLPHEWVFATLWALAKRHGAETVFRLGCAAVAAGTVALAGRRLRAWDGRVQSVVLALIVAGIMPSLGLRATILVWPLLALTMLVLEARGRRIWWVLPISVVWYNLHASALIVPAIVLAYGIGRALDARSWHVLLQPGALALATALASAATPFGMRYLPFALGWTTNPATGLISEWLPISPPTLPFFAGAFVILGLTVAGELRGAPLSWAQRLVTLALFCAALLHVRNLPFFYIAAGPWAAAGLAAFLPRRSSSTPRGVWSDRGLLAIAALGTIAIAVAGAGLSNDDPQHALPAMAPLLARAAPVRVACEDFSWCSSFAAAPHVRVFVDGRIDAYPATVLAQYRRLLEGNAAATIVDWHIDAILTRHDSPLARNLQLAHWRRVRGGETQLFVRPGFTL